MDLICMVIIIFLFNGLLLLFYAMICRVSLQLPPDSIVYQDVYQLNVIEQMPQNQFFGNQNQNQLPAPQGGLNDVPNYPGV